MSLETNIDARIEAERQRRVSTPEGTRVLSNEPVVAPYSSAETIRSVLPVASPGTQQAIAGATASISSSSWMDKLRTLFGGSSANGAMHDPAMDAVTSVDGMQRYARTALLRDWDINHQYRNEVQQRVALGETETTTSSATNVRRLATMRSRHIAFEDATSVNAGRMQQFGYFGLTATMGLATGSLLYAAKYAPGILVATPATLFVGWQSYGAFEEVSAQLRNVKHTQDLREVAQQQRQKRRLVQFFGEDEEAATATATESYGGDVAAAAAALITEGPRTAAEAGASAPATGAWLTASPAKGAAAQTAAPSVVVVGGAAALNTPRAPQQQPATIATGAVGSSDDAEKRFQQLLRSQGPAVPAIRGTA
jgi:hypothetical protein